MWIMLLYTKTLNSSPISCNLPKTITKCNYGLKFYILWQNGNEIGLFKIKYHNLLLNSSKKVILSIKLKFWVISLQNTKEHKW